MSLNLLQQQQPAAKRELLKCNSSSNSNSNVGSKEHAAGASSQTAKSNALAHMRHRSLFCTPAAPSRDYHLIIAICNLSGGSFSRKNGPRDNGGPARDSHEGPLA